MGWTDCISAVSVSLQRTLQCVAAMWMTAVKTAESYLHLLSPSHPLSSLFIQDIPERTDFLGCNPPRKHFFPLACLGANHWVDNGCS